MSKIAALLAIVAAPLLAHGALDFGPCQEPGQENFECATLAVPLDYLSRAGVVMLHVQRLRRSEQPAGLVIALAGGPGQAATPFGSQFAEELAPLLDGRQFVVFDQRGTGLSGPLDCRRPDGRMPAAAGCAQRLGSDRRFYATADSVRDLDAVRAALEAERLLVYGVSYGTLVAAQYARTFPDRVDRIVLDSPLPPEPDPVERPTFAAIPRVLAELCAGGACAEITTDPNSDLGRVVRRARHGLRIAIPDSEGRRRRQRIAPETLYNRLLLPGDLVIQLRAFLPAALAAAAGDTHPLGRLLGLTVASGAMSATGVPDVDANLGESSDSDTILLATTCLDIRFPWGSQAGIDARRRATHSFLRTAVLPGAFAPFTAPEARHVTPLGDCFGWPDTSRFDALTSAPFGPGPTLILVGTADLRTPVERTEDLLAQLPDGVRVIVPAAGHSLLPEDCVQDVLGRFDRGEQPGNACDAHRAPLPVQPVPPASLGVLPPIGAPGRPGRTVSAVKVTITDAFAASNAIGRLGSVPGVRRGLARLQRTADSRRITFERYSLVPGVEIDGELLSTSDVLTGSLTVRGRAAARGELDYADGRVTGTLGGVPIAAGAEAGPVLYARQPPMLRLIR